MLTQATATRYEIESDDEAWRDAEKRVQQATKSGKSNPLVSVKSSKTKRKAETEVDGHGEGAGEKGHAKSKKAKRDKKR